MKACHDLFGIPLARCPLCEAELDIGQGFTVDGTRYAHCQGCGTHVATTLPKPAEWRAFYRERYYKIFGAVEGRPERLAMFRSLLQSIPRRPPGRLLDVGCGAGHLLAIARVVGWDVSGVDPCGEACEIARAHYGLEVQPLAVEDANLSAESFDVVTLINVLDQVVDPAALLAAVHRILRRKGLLVVRVPNGAFHQMAWRIIQHAPLPMVRRLRPLVIFHPFSLNARALHSLLARFGFECIRVDNALICADKWSTSRWASTRVVLTGLSHAGHAFASAAAALTTGRFLCAPSLMAFAERGE